MAIETVIWKGAEVILTTVGSAGAKILVEEAVKKLTPENLNKAQEYCVEVAKWGGSATIAAGVSWGIHKNVENAKKLSNKINSLFNAADAAEHEDAEPVIDSVEETDLIEIEEEDEPEEIPVVDLD